MSKIIRYSILACLFLSLASPLFLGSNFLFPFISLKTFYFRTVIEIAVFLYLILAAFYPNFRPRFNKAVYALLAFVLIIIIASLLGPDPYRSFWSTIERGEGWLTYIHVAAAFFVAINVFKSRKEWLYFFTASILVSLAVDVYALMQYYGISFVVANSSGNRMSSTLGNPAYLGAYALGHFWLAVFMFSQSRPMVLKIIFTCVAAFEAFIVYRTETRGALLALGVTFVVFLLWQFFTTKKQLVKKISLAAFICLIAFGVLIAAFPNSKFVSSQNSLHRLATISLRDITTESRLLAWQTSWQAWQDRFLFGYGWENYNLAYNQYFPAQVYLDNGSRIWFDRAHNTFFDIAVNTGLIGIIAWLSIYVFTLIGLKNFLRTGGKISLVAAPFLLIVGHFMQNLFVFDSLSTYIMLFYVLAFLTWLSLNVDYKPAKIKPKPALTIISAMLGAAAFVFLPVSIYQFNLKPAQANTTAIEGMKLVYQNQLEAGMAKFDEAMALNTYHNRELRQKIIEQIARQNSNSNISDASKRKEIWQYAISLAKQNIAEAPNDVQHYLLLMMLYNNSAGDLPQNISKVYELGERALEMSPTRPQIYFEMGRAEIAQGNFTSGIRYFKQGVDLVPHTLDAHWNLLTAYIISGAEEEVREEYAQMLNLGLPENETNLVRIISMHSSAQRYAESIYWYEKLINLAPNKPDYISKLAATYLQIGDVTRARQAALIMKSKFPDLQEVADQFLEKLPQ